MRLPHPVRLLRPVRLLLVLPLHPVWLALPGPARVLHLVPVLVLHPAWVLHPVLVLVLHPAWLALQVRVPVLLFLPAWLALPVSVDRAPESLLQPYRDWDQHPDVCLLSASTRIRA